MNYSRFTEDKEVWSIFGQSAEEMLEVSTFISIRFEQLEIANIRHLCYIFTKDKVFNWIRDMCKGKASAGPIIFGLDRFFNPRVLFRSSSGGVFVLDSKLKLLFLSCFL